MFKAYFLFKPGIDDPFRFQSDEASSHIREHFPGVVSYVQTRALPDQDAVSFSGSAELWFLDSVSAIAACQKGIDPLLADGAEIDSVLAGMERVVVRTPEYLSADRIKGVYPFCKKEGMTLAEFQHHWWYKHGPIAALTEEALSYIQIHPILDTDEMMSSNYDGITEISWPDVAAASRAIESRQMREDQGGDAPNFVDMDSIALFLAKEELVIAP